MLYLYKSENKSTNKSTRIVYKNKTKIVINVPDNRYVADNDA